MIKNHKTEILLMMVGITIVLSVYGFLRPQEETAGTSNTFIDAPFSADMLLISSAGQSTDLYVFHDLANKLHLNNHFMPEADLDEVDKYSAAIIVVGYSEVGMMLNDMTYDEELERLTRLTEKFKASNKPVVVAFIGGPDRRSTKTDSMLESICKSSDFIILNSHDMDREFVRILSNNGIVPVSEVDAIDQVSMSLAFLFR